MRILHPLAYLTPGSPEVPITQDHADLQLRLINLLREAQELGYIITVDTVRNPLREHTDMVGHVRPERGRYL